MDKLIPQERAGLMERVVVEGDLSKLSPQDRLSYYRHVCESLALNPYTKPFDYIKLNSKLILYARKDATDQLRKIHGVSICKIEKSLDEDGTYTVTAYARDRQGREDVEEGIVPLAGLKGDALANAKMKAVTKAKRRVTLSICGLGWLDETETETIPGAVPIQVQVGDDTVNTSTGEVVVAPPESGNSQEEKKGDPPWVRFRQKCGELKEKIGEEAYYKILAQFEISKCSEIPKDDTVRMSALVKTLEAEAQAQAAGL